MLEEAENAKYYRFAIKRFQTTQTSAVTIKHKIMSALDIISNLLLLFAGIGVFLIATKLMSSNLELVGGNKLKSMFAKTSKNKFLGVGIGTIGTALIQSSGATSVMTIGFVNAGIMTVAQAAPILLGANIGTTITGQIVAIGFLTGSGTNFSATILFSALAGVGALMTYFSKKDMVKKVGGILSGLGLLFVALNTMSTAMKPFANGVVQEFIASISFRGFEVLLMLVGVLLTAVIQSSSVTSSIAITMLISGLINLDQGIYLVLGSNIGAVGVALLACVGSKTNAKRAALFHLVEAVTRVVVFIVIVEIIIAATGNQFFMGDLFKLMFPNFPQFQLSMFHTLFNLVTVLILTPFANLFVKLVEKIIPEKHTKVEPDTKQLTYIDEHFLNTPPIAVEQVRKEVLRMAEIAMENFDLSLDTICTLDFSKLETFKKNEDHLNFLNREITKYIVKITKTTLSETDNAYISTVFHTVSDLERIGDYAENIMEYATKLTSLNKGFSDEATEEIRTLQKTIEQLYQKVMKVYVTSDFKTLKEAYEIEDLVDDMTNQMSDKHIERLVMGVCSPDIGAQYLSLTSNSERIADHFINIAKAVRSFSKTNKNSDNNLIEPAHKDKLTINSAEESAEVFEQSEETKTEE